jgi:predicted small secreted protein
LLIAVLGLYGCETAKGFGKDVHNTWENISRTDKWFQKNAW